MTEENLPTILTCDDIDKMLLYLKNYEIKKRCCFKCSKDFFANYDDMKCDECFFSQFPKDDVRNFYKSFLV